jgi:hypothetical protein
MRVSHAFLRLCQDAGCPIANDRASASQVLLWLFDHYEQVRVLAGFAPLAQVEGLRAETMSRLRMANAAITLLEFSRTRATNWQQKRVLRIALEKVNVLGDGAA